MSTFYEDDVLDSVFLEDEMDVEDEEFGDDDDDLGPYDEEGEE